jgi:hypothetical protein
MTYHLGCIWVGEPFCSHLGGDRGLVYPCTRIAPLFIFEACTVRAQLGTELEKTASHLSLLMLEHMRLIDQANAWSPSTHSNYQASLGRLRKFEHLHGVSLLHPMELSHPPCHPSIGVMWAQQQYVLQTPTSNHTQSEERTRFGTTRALRSAASQFYLWGRQIAHPERTLHDPASRKVYLADSVSPTDALGYGLMAAGMARRMGDQSKPPIALTLCQVFWVMQYLDAQWVASHSRDEHRELAVAAVTHLFGWLGWLRSQELSSLTWGDIKVTGPADGPRIGLVPGIGVIELRLLPETKSSRMKVADVIISRINHVVLT